MENNKFIEEKSRLIDSICFIAAPEGFDLRRAYTQGLSSGIKLICNINKTL